MVYNLIGVKRKTGDYNGTPYDKLQLYCTLECVGQEAAGQEYIDLKKTSFPVLRAPQICQDVRSYSDFFELIGCKIDLSFNQYGNVDRISVVSE